ncbi:MAG: hypothetical protein L6R39_007653 [Caloplaca ligustica]|nr:MAG: hypothetical protein L6R39_007653 [Caloplaca ligustica]
MPTQITNSASTFLTNLRLLDLDCLEDWPDLTTGLFASKDAVANQKQRIRCVEWALYRLCELWNPKEAKNKLQPFFPPYDALRSINLRAAVFRCLNQLKKDGVLGKEVVIRKTMFDECKGDKFEDLLASFSTIVLQKIARRQPSAKTSVAGRLVTCSNLSGREHSSLLPMAIAHQRALSALLYRKVQLRQRCADFEDVLKAKERQLLAKVEELAQADTISSLQAVPDRDVQVIHQHFEKNWHGNEDWITSLLQGDKRDAGDPLLDAPFSRVWAHVENGSVADIEANGQKGLVQDLNGRIRAQQLRLRHWQNVHQNMVKSRPRSPIKAKENNTPYRNRGLQSPLKFGHLEQNQVNGYMKSGDTSPDTKMRYHELLERRRGVSRAVGSTGPNTPFKHTTSTSVPGAMSFARDEPVFQPTTPSPIAPMTPQRNLGISMLESGETSKKIQWDGAAIGASPETAQPDETHNATERKEDMAAACDGRAFHNTSSNLQGNQGNFGGAGTAQQDSSAGCLRPSISPTVENELSHEDMLAQQIISSAMNADLSPIKCKVSLTERTRQSIAFARPEAFLPDPLDGSTLIYTDQKAEPSSTQIHTLQRSASLLERTRRSISLVPASKGPRKSIHGRRQSKQYPRNQFETPRKQLEDLEEMTPPEILFSPEADYASVFKSRPKVATSPNISPTLARGLQWDDGGKDENVEPTGY